MHSRLHTDAGKLRKYLAFLDELSLFQVINNVTSNVNHRHSVNPHHILLMLPSAILKHKLYPTDSSAVAASYST